MSIICSDGSTYIDVWCREILFQNILLEIDLRGSDAPEVILDIYFSRCVSEALRGGINTIIIIIIPLCEK